MKNKKIYVVLTQTYTCLAKTIKFISKKKYSHASISLDKECKNMYSFGRKYDWFLIPGIFKKENIGKGLFVKNKNSLVAIYEVDVTSEQYEMIKSVIDRIKNNNSGYNIIGLLLAYFRIKLNRNKYYCSEFVYEVLSSEGVDIFDRNIKRFAPEEMVLDNFNKIYEGKIRDYIAETI